MWNLTVYITFQDSLHPCHTDSESDRKIRSIISAIVFSVPILLPFDHRDRQSPIVTTANKGSIARFSLLLILYYIILYFTLVCNNKSTIGDHQRAQIFYIHIIYIIMFTYIIIILVWFPEYSNTVWVFDELRWYKSRWVVNAGGEECVCRVKCVRK